MLKTDGDFQGVPSPHVEHFVTDNNDDNCCDGVVVVVVFLCVSILRGLGRK